MTTTALVTGGSGYVASHLILQLLERGYVVNTTVRDARNAHKMQFLTSLGTKYEGRLNIFEADLLKSGSFDRAASGCQLVFHVASPFLLPEKIKDGRSQMLEPALLGTRNVLESASRAGSVRRIVFTSTVGAIFGDYADVRHMADGVLQERYFNTSSTLENNPYHYAKTMAEKEAWSICESQSNWSMVALNPGLIMGPSLSPGSDSGSLFLLDEMFRGYFFYGAPGFSFTYVDVRDVALAHVLAAEKQEAHGRYILAEKNMISLLDMARIVRPVHRRKYVIPTIPAPNWAVRLLGPFFGLTQDYIRNHLGIRFPVDNRRSIDELGLRYRPIEETLIDHYRAWEAELPRAPR